MCGFLDYSKSVYSYERDTRHGRAVGDRRSDDEVDKAAVEFVVSKMKTTAANGEQNGSLGLYSIIFLLTG